MTDPDDELPAVEDQAPDGENEVPEGDGQVDAELGPARRGDALDVAEMAFGFLTCGPDPLALDCTGLGTGVPAGVVPLDRLRELLTRAPYPVRNRVWPELVIAAQQGGPAWLVGVVGVALPGLRQIASGVAAGCGELREDLDSEVLTGFFAALSQADPDDDRLLNRLYWAAERAGRRRRAQDSVSAQRGGRELPSSAEPRPPTGHPDLVLAAAVRDGVLSRLQAELICQTRLEKRLLREVAQELGLTVEQLRRRRRAGETNLVAALAVSAEEKSPPRQPHIFGDPPAMGWVRGHHAPGAAVTAGTAGGVPGPSRTSRKGELTRPRQPRPPEPVMPPHPTTTAAHRSSAHTSGADIFSTEGHLS